LKYNSAQLYGQPNVEMYRSRRYFITSLVYHQLLIFFFEITEFLFYFQKKYSSKGHIKLKFLKFNKANKGVIKYETDEPKKKVRAKLEYWNSQLYC